MLHHPNVCKHKRQSILNWELTVTSQAINWRLFLSYTYGSSSVILTALPWLYLRFVLSYTNGLNSRLQFVRTAIYSWIGSLSTVGSSDRLPFTWNDLYTGYILLSFNSLYDPSLVACSRLDGGFPFLLSSSILCIGEEATPPHTTFFSMAIMRRSLGVGHQHVPFVSYQKEYFEFSVSFFSFS